MASVATIQLSFGAQLLVTDSAIATLTDDPDLAVKLWETRHDVAEDALGEDDPILADIDFSEMGNSTLYQLGGWSHQEPKFIWATGGVSALFWPDIGPCTAVTIEMDLYPCLLPPYRAVQRLFVRSDQGLLLGRADIDRAGPARFVLPDHAAAAGLLRLVLHHPDFIIPFEAGGHQDARELSIAFRRITIRGRRIAPEPMAAPTADADIAPGDDLADKEMILHFEGLGGTAQGCEFGLLQRELGAEPLGLMRWTHITAESLADALESGFEGLGTPEQTILDTFEWADHEEYRIDDRRYLMSMHSWVKKDEKPYDDMFRLVCQRLIFLKRKLLDDLAEGNKIFVFKRGDQICTPEQIAPIHRALRRYGRNTLLYVRTETEEHPAGTVVQAVDGLLIGYITQFNIGPDGLVRPIALHSWLSVCRSAYRIWCDQRTKPIDPANSTLR